MSQTLYRNIQLCFGFMTLLVLSASLYFQYYLGLAPCPLCLMQRLCVIALLLLTGFAVFAKIEKHASKLVAGQIIFSLLGLYFSGRQLWLQYLPSGTTPACMPDLEILIKYFPWKDVAKALFWGAGDCAEVSWQWFGLSMPAWSLIYFLSMLFIALALYRRLPSRSIKD